MKKKYVYVIYVPLYERVLCVHNEPNMECDACRKTRKERDNAYYLRECKKLIKTKQKFYE